MVTWFSFGEIFSVVAEVRVDIGIRGIRITGTPDRCVEIPSWDPHYGQSDENAFCHLASILVSWVAHLRTAYDRLFYKAVGTSIYSALSWNVEICCEVYRRVVSIRQSRVARKFEMGNTFCTVEPNSTLSHIVPLSSSFTLQPNDNVTSEFLQCNV